jgi:hypothetical protein
MGQQPPPPTPPLCRPPPSLEPLHVGRCSSTPPQVREAPLTPPWSLPPSLRPHSFAHNRLHWLAELVGDESKVGSGHGCILSLMTTAMAAFIEEQAEELRRGERERRGPRIKLPLHLAPHSPPPLATASSRAAIAGGSESRLPPCVRETKMGGGERRPRPV